MRYRFIYPPGLAFAFVVLAVAGSVQAAPPDAYVLAERADQVLERAQSANGVKPAPLADDAEFLRRASLDIVGRIPASADVYAFLADTAPDKRRQLIDKLLRSPGYVTHHINLWRALLMPETMTNVDMRSLQPGFDAWLRQKLRDNAPYDRLAY